MRYREFTPAPALQPYVQLIWSFETDGLADGRTDGSSSERIAPDGIVELVLHFRGRMHVRLARGPGGPPPRTSLVCQTTRFADLDQVGGVGFVSVRFLPWGALHFFAPPVSDLADRIVSAGDLWGNEVATLEERLDAAPSLAERVAVIEHFLLERLERHRRRGVEEAVRAVWRKGGDVRVPALTDELGISTRSAQRLFRTAVGMSPKSYARLVRFLSACRILRGDGPKRLGETAQRCGYFDQAHFAADFKAFSGTTPGAFVRTGSFSFLEVD